MKAPEETKTGLMIARGFTEKEVANFLGKSVHTVKQQKRRLFEKTGSRNIADLTRNLISRYSGLNTDDILLQAMKDLTIIVAIVMLTAILSDSNILEFLKASIIDFSSIIQDLSAFK